MYSTFPVPSPPHLVPKWYFFSLLLLMISHGFVFGFQKTNQKILPEREALHIYLLFPCFEEYFSSSNVVPHIIPNGKVGFLLTFSFEGCV